MQGNSVKILIAEDDPEDMELIGDAIMLAEPTAELYKFTNGLSAYEHLRSVPDNELPSLIILDYNMPQLTGAQVLSSISTLSRYTSIPKVILSTSNAHIYKHECMNNGATEYFVKPSSMKDLRALAKKLIAFCL